MPTIKSVLSVVSKNEEFLLAQFHSVEGPSTGTCRHRNILQPVWHLDRYAVDQKLPICKLYSLTRQPNTKTAYLTTFLIV